jgi:hypothetical protein
MLHKLEKVAMATSVCSAAAEILSQISGIGYFVHKFVICRQELQETYSEPEFYLLTTSKHASVLSTYQNFSFREGLEFFQPCIFN